MQLSAGMETNNRLLGLFFFFLASMGAINASRVKESNTLRQFARRISGLDGIHRYDTGKNMEDFKLHS